MNGRGEGVDEWNGRREVRREKEGRVERERGKGRRKSREGNGKEGRGMKRGKGDNKKKKIKTTNITSLPIYGIFVNKYKIDVLK